MHRKLRACLGARLNRQVLSLLLGLLLAVLSPPSSFAAEKSDKDGRVAARGPKKQLSTIVLAGVAGGILGMSTLSFYGRPQDRLKYIPIGAAIGIIIGATYTTFKAATEPRDFYTLSGDRGLSASRPNLSAAFLQTDATARVVNDEERWASLENPRHQVSPKFSTPQLSFQFTF